MNEEAKSANAVVTVPNAISAVRLLALPLLVWLILTHSFGWALALLIVAGASDYLDGYIARATGQISRVGELLDPIADRLYIACTLIAMAIAAIIPWWLVAVLVLRDLVVGVFLLALRRTGTTGLAVTFLGKTATFLLLWGFPFLLGGATDWGVAPVAEALGWALVLWGTFLYWWVGVDYIRVIRHRLRTAIPPTA